MRNHAHLITTAVLTLALSVQSAAAQTPAGIWRSFAERVSIGTELDVRLEDGQRMRATLVGVREDAVLLQPKTRITVPVQAVPYDKIVRMEPRKRGHSAGKALAIGAATGAGVFFGVMAVLVAVIGE
jgi:hypothetical protein